MSKKTIWTAARLAHWDWRVAESEERRAKRKLPYATWWSPGSGVSEEAVRDRRSVGTVITWSGVTLTALAVMVLALSALYNRLDSVFTGATTGGGISLWFLLSFGTVGLCLGVFGFVLGSGDNSERHRRAAGEGREPDTPAAA